MTPFVRRALRQAVAVAARWTGLLWICRRLERRVFACDGVILCYHRVLPSADGHCDYSQRGIVASLSHFEGQMASLRGAFHVTSLTAYLNGSAGASRKPVAIVTFEDGWADNYEHACPVLKRYRIPATIFLTTDFVEIGRPFWHTTLIYLLLHGDLKTLRPWDLPHALYPEAVVVRLARLRDLPRRPALDDVDDLVESLKSLRQEAIEALIGDLAVRLDLSLEPVLSRRFALSWPLAREMAAHGIQYGAHGVSHRILTTLSPEEVEAEAVGARRAIEERLGTPVHVFLCPNGDSTPAIQRILRGAGFRHILPAAGPADPRLLRLRRVNMHDGRSAGPWGRFSPSRFAFEISGLRETGPEADRHPMRPTVSEGGKAMIPDRHTLALRHPLRHYLRPHWMRAYATDRLQIVLGELRAWLNGLTRLIPGKIGSRIRLATLGFKRYGKNVRVWEMAWIKFPENISIGDDVRIHPMTYLDAAGGIEIGSHVGIAPGVTIYSSNHRYRDADRPYTEQGYEFGKVVIEDDVWIGARSVILAGVRLAPGTVVAAGAVVTKDTEPYSVVAGVPARIIGNRTGPSETAS